MGLGQDGVGMGTGILSIKSFHFVNIHVRPRNELMVDWLHQIISCHAIYRKPARAYNINEFGE